MMAPRSRNTPEPALQAVDVLGRDGKRWETKELKPRGTVPTQVGRQPPGRLRCKLEKARRKRLYLRLSMGLAHLQRRLHSTSETVSIQELSAHDGHPAEIGTITAERALDAGLRRNLRGRRDDIGRLLVKIEKGSYGCCDRCGVAIEPDRLEAALGLPCAEIVHPSYYAEDAADSDPAPAKRLGAAKNVANSSPGVPPAVTDTEIGLGSQPGEGVKAVDSMVDKSGRPLLDTVRSRAPKKARRTEPESAGY